MPLTGPTILKARIMDYQELQAYVTDKLSEIKSGVSYLAEQLENLKTKEKDNPRTERKIAIDAIELLFRGLELGVKINEGAETKDETDCKCGMSIKLTDLGSGDLNKRTAGLINALAEHERKLNSLEKTEPPNGEPHSLEDLQYNYN